MTVDPTKPNISRVYDYMLGGHHNLEIDRIMAAQLLKVVPSYPTWARLNRWFLQLVAQKWQEDGHTSILDLASGLPTQDHFHELVPKAQILYCDNDPITVKYAQDVLAGNPRVSYQFGDIRDINPLLAHAEAHFTGNRQVAVGLIGVAYLMDADILSQLARDIHAWTAPGSVLAMTTGYSTSTPEEFDLLVKTAQKMGSTFYQRTDEELLEIMSPWRLVEMRDLVDWLGVEIEIAPDDRIGQTARFKGAIFER